MVPSCAGTCCREPPIPCPEWWQQKVSSGQGLQGVQMDSSHSRDEYLMGVLIL